MATTQTMARRERERPDPIDVVAIVTPNHLHLPVAARSSTAGFDVICDKPLTTTLAEAEELVRLVEASGRVFVLSHNYTAYPMVREARAMVAAGALGRLRVVQVEYPQDWLATPLEQQGQKQAEWRTDPARSGPGGTVADIGTHAHSLACFVTGLELREVAADVNIHVPGRRIDDNIHALLRFDGRCDGHAVGEPGGTRQRQRAPAARLRRQGRAHLGAGGPGRPAPGACWARRHARSRAAVPAVGRAAARLTRLPDGCPEGFLEGFANLYGDAAELIWARMEGRAARPRRGAAARRARRAGRHAVHRGGARPRARTTAPGPRLAQQGVSGSW